MEMSSSTQTENKIGIVGDKDEQEICHIILVQPDFYQASIKISNLSEEEFSEKDDDVSEEEISLWKRNVLPKIFSILLKLYYN